MNYEGKGSPYEYHLGLCSLEQAKVHEHEGANRPSAPAGLESGAGCSNDQRPGCTERGVQRNAVDSGRPAGHRWFAHRPDPDHATCHPAPSRPELERLVLLVGIDTLDRLGLCLDLGTDAR
ncbi:hypothetical protein D3C75_1112060 [compost metagenome]